MGYKVPIQVLEGFKKALEDSNKTLVSFKSSPSKTTLDSKIDKQIKANNKQIKLIEDEFYIGKKQTND